MGTQLTSLKKGAELTQFSAHFYFGEMAGCIRMPLGMELGLSSGDFVFDGDPEKGHTHPTQFLAHVYCGQRAGWVKTPLGTEVDLGPGHIVLERGPSCPRKRHSSPLLSAHIYCGHGRPSQLSLSYCFLCNVTKTRNNTALIISTTYKAA